MQERFCRLCWVLFQDVWWQSEELADVQRAPGGGCPWIRWRVLRTREVLQGIRQLYWGELCHWALYRCAQSDSLPCCCCSEISRKISGPCTIGHSCETNKILIVSVSGCEFASYLGFFSGEAEGEDWDPVGFRVVWASYAIESRQLCCSKGTRLSHWMVITRFCCKHIWSTYLCSIRSVEWSFHLKA